MNTLFWYKLSTFFLIISLFVLGLLLFWLVYPYVPVTFSNIPFPVDEKIVKAGGILTYETDYCKYNNLIPTSTKTFVDDIIYNTPATTVLAKEIGCNKLKVGVQVPQMLPPGIYTLHITYRYKVNPIRYVDINARTDEFQVVK